MFYFGEREDLGAIIPTSGMIAPMRTDCSVIGMVICMLCLPLIKKETALDL